MKNKSFSNYNDDNDVEKNNEYSFVDAENANISNININSNYKQFSH